MARIDTGLGWWAEERFLFNSNGDEIANVGTYAPSSNTIPLVPSPEGKEDMLYIGLYRYAPTRIQHAYVCVLEQEDDVHWFFYNFPNNQLDGDATFQARAYYYSTKPFRVKQIVWWTDGQYVYTDSSSYNSSTGLYYIRDWWTVNGVYQFANAPVYSTEEDGIAAIGYYKSITKNGDGYVTAAVVHYANNDALILISTDANYCMADFPTGTFPSIDLINVQQDNIVYYMRRYITTGVDLTADGREINTTISVTLPYNIFNPLYIFEEIGGPKIDPYSGNGDSGPGGGGGIGYDNIISDDIDFPNEVSISASNANFISIWTPTLEQTQRLASWLWSTNPIKTEFWQKLLQNPLELIYSLSIMPIPIFHTTDTGIPAPDDLVALNSTVTLGWQDTHIYMDYIDKQYVTIDMGSINIQEVWGAFLDYEPYTKIDIYLPYIGVKQLDTNDCMPRIISLKYIIDLATGTCLALIKCDNSIYYHFSGNCASQIPITANQCQEIVRGLMTMVVGAATMVAAPALSGAGVVDSASKAALGGLATTGMGANNAAKGVTVSRSGTVSSAAGLMDVQTPYLIISRPRQAMPKDQNKYTGYPSFITELIGDLHGYTEIKMIHLEHMSCTDEEYKEIDTLLVEGVIV